MGSSGAGREKLGSVGEGGRVFEGGRSRRPVV